MRPEGEQQRPQKRRFRSRHSIEREENMNVRNGYSPEATTLCRLWLDNDEREYRFTQAAIAEAVRNRETREERIIMLAGRLEEFMKLNAPDLGGG